jgi:aspartyl-tRNA(Asn)/glutamyl-tRNA(Gln) amidotransferase subunit C
VGRIFMAKFDSKSLEHLKKLCRIQCTEEEDRDIMNNIDRVLNYAEQLNEIDTSNTKTCRYVLRGMQRGQMREDEPKDLLPRDQFLSNAPDQIGGMIRVPPILKPGV